MEQELLVIAQRDFGWDDTVKPRSRKNDGKLPLVARRLRQLKEAAGAEANDHVDRGFDAIKIYVSRNKVKLRELRERMAAEGKFEVLGAPAGSSEPEESAGTKPEEYAGTKRQRKG
ncbi:unnamed protein product [Pedinophyceae sp. YPF-701]|nr:unnamed protein product [Pedinophyceae sp. YPF-701]